MRYVSLCQKYIYNTNITNTNTGLGIIYVNVIMLFLWLLRENLPQNIHTPVEFGWKIPHLFAAEVIKKILSIHLVTKIFLLSVISKNASDFTN